MKMVIGMDIHCKKTVYLARDKAWRIVGRGSGRGLLMGLLSRRIRFTHDAPLGVIGPDMAAQADYSLLLEACALLHG